MKHNQYSSSHGAGNDHEGSLEPVCRADFHAAVGEIVGLNFLLSIEPMCSRTSVFVVVAVRRCSLMCCIYNRSDKLNLLWLHSGVVLFSLQI